MSTQSDQNRPIRHLRGGAEKGGTKGAPVSRNGQSESERGEESLTPSDPEPSLQERQTWASLVAQW